MKKFYFLTLIFLLAGIHVFAEGTLQLITCPTCEAGMSLNDKAQFAYPGLAEDRRLHIRIADPTNERIYVSLSEQWYVRLVSPDGADFYVFDGTEFMLNGTSAAFPNTITDYTQNTLGPNGVTQAGTGGETSGSYDAVSFAPNVAGDWYIEFTDQPDFSTPTEGARCQYWDISVVNVGNVNNDVINGRLWSYQWGMRSGPGSVAPGPGPRLNSTFYVYTEPEQVVTSIEVGDPDNPGWGGDWLIACNRYGIIQSEYDAGNPGEARKSIDGDADAIYGALSEYKIFVNDPDIIEFPSGIDEIELSTISLDECGSGQIFITFNTNVEGVGDLTLDFPPFGAGSEDVTYPAESIQVGANTIEWDRLDGNGNNIPDGTVFRVRLFVGGSIVHFPLYDIEGLTGLKAQLVRPGTPGYIGLYWDNTNFAGGEAVVADPGCISSDSEICNDYGYANEETLNVWWNGLNVSVETDVVVPTAAQISVNVVDDPNTTCGPSGILVLMDAQAVNINAVEWTTSGTGYFDDPNAVMPIYHASSQDSIAGSVTLTLSGAACPDVTDFTTINFPDALCALPISLSDFDATVLNTNEHCDGIKVTWTTQTEENTDYFVVERSTDGINFFEVDRISAAGFSLTIQDYVLLDKNVGSKNYYRLIVHDFDGSTQDILLDYVVYTDCFRGIDVNNISNIFPNPVNGSAASFLKINLADATDVNINIVDIHGRLVTSIPRSLAQGENMVQFHLGDLEAGTYFISLMSDKWQSSHKKIVKLN